MKLISKVIGLMCIPNQTATFPASLIQSVGIIFLLLRLQTNLQKKIIFKYLRCTKITHCSNVIKLVLKTISRIFTYIGSNVQFLLLLICRLLCCRQENLRHKTWANTFQLCNWYSSYCIHNSVDATYRWKM